MKFLRFKIIFVLLLSANFSIADEFSINEKNNTKLNFYTGMFDFSDEGKKSGLIGLQHQNVDLNRNTFLGNLSPITGAMITEANSTYFYTGVQAQYKIGAIDITPSFAPGYYNEGNGKDLGHALEFKSEVQLSLELPKQSQTSVHSTISSPVEGRQDCSGGRQLRHRLLRRRLESPVEQ